LLVVPVHVPEHHVEAAIGVRLPPREIGYDFLAARVLELTAHSTSGDQEERGGEDHRKRPDVRQPERASPHDIPSPIRDLPNSPPACPSPARRAPPCTPPGTGQFSSQDGTSCRQSSDCRPPSIFSAPRFEGSWRCCRTTR